MFVDGKEEAPPGYVAATSIASSSTSTAYVDAQLPLDARRVNLFTRSVNNERITGAFVVDPELAIPESLLPPLQSGETRRHNLKLESHYKSVTADVWVLDSGRDSKVSRTSLWFGGRYASTDVKLHSLGNVPCHVVADVDYYNIRLALPPDFVGKITVNRGKNGSIKHMSPRVQQLSDVDGRLVCVVGDARTLATEGWQGHEVEIRTSYGKVHVGFLDELQDSTSSTWSWASLFGVAR